LKSNYNVVINVSRIPNSGLGLFCNTSSDIGAKERKDRAKPIFKKGDFICPYGGHELKQSTLDRLYDYIHDGKEVENTGPYAIQSERDHYAIDATCFRQAGAYANDGVQSGKTTNAEIHPDGLYALRNIYRGDEIYLNYGAAYWSAQGGLDMVTKNVRVSSKAAKTKYRGQYIRNGKHVQIP
jgi:hypothetical protein